MNKGRRLDGVEIIGLVTEEFSREVLSEDALFFLTKLHRKFNQTRLDLLLARQKRAHEIESTGKLGFLEETKATRESSFRVASAPPDLVDRRVEITGPVEAKMMINALNSGAKVFMADLEDATSPSWENVVSGQINLKRAVRKTLRFESPEGKQYQLSENLATLVVRPRGWHLCEKHLVIDGAPISASLFDFGLYFFHNAQETLKRGSGPYFYLPKMESYKEARLWNEVFDFAQNEVGVPRGSVRATVLIETIPAAFEMDEILFELKEHASGLNAGRWDYIFSCIKKFSNDKDRVFPDRSQVTMAVPFMRAYTQLLVQTCHKRGAHAIGGMSAFIPSRKDEHVNATALSKVREDKNREVGDGCDGTWVAHPDLVTVAREIFDPVLKDKPNQKDKQRPDVKIQGHELIDFKIPGGTITEGGVQSNISIGLQYLAHWLKGNGAVALNHLMEDAATAEISRAQLWQWLKHEVTLDDGRVLDQKFYETIRDSELRSLATLGYDAATLKKSTMLLDKMILAPEFVEFLTIPAYEWLA